MGRNGYSMRFAIEYALEETKQLLGEEFKLCVLDDDCLQVIEEMQNEIIRLIIDNKYYVVKKWS